MKSLITYSIIFLSIHFVSAQTSFQGISIIFDEIKLYDTPKSLSELSTIPDDFESTFAKYYHTKNIEQYKSLFQNGEAPPISIIEYESWMKKIQSLDIKLHAYLCLSANGHQYIIFQYSYRTEAFLFNDAMIFKKIADKYFYLRNNSYPYDILNQLGNKEWAIINDRLNKIDDINFDLIENRPDQVDILDKLKYENKLKRFMANFNFSENEIGQIMNLYQQGQYFSMAEMMTEKVDGNYYNLYKLLNQAIGVKIFSISQPSIE